MASVELLHGCQAVFLREEIVRVTSGSVTIQRDVAVFELRGDPAPAPLAYAWTDQLLGDRSVHYQVVLHRGVVKSATHAVAGFFLSDSTSPDAPAPASPTRVRQRVVGHIGYEPGPNRTSGDARPNAD